MVLALMLIFVFIVGAAVGSFLNVAIARLPLEKSLLWPNSRCGSCLQSIRWYDNIPLISYLWLRGRCRTCGQSYSIVYFIVELSVALGFVGLFCLEIVVNVHRWPDHSLFATQLGFPLKSCLGFAWHALLFSFLVVASVCDLRSREIPLQLTLTGTLFGLIGSALMPWPMPHALGVAFGATDLNQGIYVWPFWHPLPEWCGAGGNWQTGLATGVVGALVGTFLVRGIAFVFNKGRGKEGLGLGDADLMMMAGAFLGWQVVVVSFFLSPIFAIAFSIINWIVTRDELLPFGPFLSASAIATCLAWQPIGHAVQLYFFWPELLFWAVVLCAVSLFVMSFMLRLMRKPEVPEK